jgi:hypothetical protein
MRLEDKEKKQEREGNEKEKETRTMGLVVLVLLLALLFGGLGFAAHAFWLIAGVLLVLWILGFLVRGAEGARWYRW